jgi:hypothetical protein
VTGDLYAAAAAAGALIDAVASGTGVHGRLLARRDDPSTWMEIYEDVDDPAAFERALNGLASSHGVLAFVDGGRRHTERFASLPDALA